MANYKLILEYDGTEYHGFQRQPAHPTVQGVLEEALERIAVVESSLYAAGRTDAGVHARGQVVSFKGSLKVPPARLAHALNAFLPPDVVIKGAAEVEEGFNARKSAVAREYIYYLYLGSFPPALNRSLVHHYGDGLDEDSISNALSSVIGVHDFASFSRLEKGRSSVREVYEAELIRWGDILGIRVKSNAFAWMMMRMLTGSLLEVGRGKWSVDYFREVLEVADNALGGPALPPNGLVLEKVYY